MGFLDNFKNNVISQEEKAGIEQEITEYFSLTNLQHASGKAKIGDNAFALTSYQWVKITDNF